VPSARNVSIYIVFPRDGRSQLAAVV